VEMMVNELVIEDEEQGDGEEVEEWGHRPLPVIIASM